MANHEKDLERTSERVKTLGEAQEHRVAEIVARSGVLDGREPWRPTREWDDIAPAPGDTVIA